MDAALWTTVGIVAIGVVVAYIVGSIPNGVIVGRLMAGVDIRKHGSGNIGTTNAIRITGWKTGVIVGVLDIVKGVLGTLLMMLFLFILTGPMAQSIGPHAAALSAGWERDLAMGLAMFATVLGHTHSIFLKFGGGKGIATAFGTFTVACPWCALTSLIGFLALCFITRYVSVGSLAGAAGYFIGTLIFYNQSIPFVVTAVLICALVTFEHRGNIKRLIHGEESKFHAGSKEELAETRAAEQEEAAGARADER